MRSKPLKTCEADTPERWRRWLGAYHDSESEVWLIFNKRASGKPSLAYEDAVDEALCVGWVDSLVKRLDNERYARKFTPRKPDSKWSALNRRRYARLKAAGRLTAAGLCRAPTNRPAVAPAQLVSTIPRYIQVALKQHPQARAHFDQLAPSHRRQYVGWIHSAKRPETRMRRLEEAIRLLAAGRKLGLK